MNEMNEQPRKRFLVLDTATAAQTVAVMEGIEVLAAESSSADRNHSVGLMGSISRMLEQSGTARHELDGIAVGVGPGSYTGIRIAVTTAKTLAWTLKLPVAGFSSLAALAKSGYQAAVNKQLLNAKAEMNQVIEADDSSLNRQDYNPITKPTTRTSMRWVIPLIDGRRGQVYTGLFAMQSADSIPEQIQPDRIMLMEDWVQALANYYLSLDPQQRPQHIWFVGETSGHEERAQRLTEQTGTPIEIHSCAMEAESTGIIGASVLLSGHSDPVHTLLPNYTQLSEAEANLLRQS